MQWQLPGALLLHGLTADDDSLRITFLCASPRHDAAANSWVVANLFFHIITP